jgi:hypothetical protein
MRREFASTFAFTYGAVALDTKAPPMAENSYAITSSLAVEGHNPSARQFAALFWLVDEAAIRAWLVENGLPLSAPPSRPRLTARYGLLRDPAFAPVVHVEFGSPIVVRKIVRGAKRAAIVVAATSATLGTTLYGVNEALDQLSVTIDRVEHIYEQIRDFGEGYGVARDERRILHGRGEEPTISPRETTVHRIRSPRGR